MMCGITSADLCMHPRGRVKLGAGINREGIKMECFGIAAPIALGNGHVRALRHSMGAPSS